MARHKIYASMTPFLENGNTGKLVSVHSKDVINAIYIELNDENDVSGEILVKQVRDTKEIEIYLNCPNYNVIVGGAKDYV